jgi:hypothetical protein
MSRFGRYFARFLLGIGLASLAGFSSLAGLAGLAGCGGTQKKFENGVFQDGRVSFRVPAPPPSWQRIELTDASLAFRDDSRGATILVSGRCGGKDDDTPLPALLNHLVMGTTERDFVKEETIPFDAREARHAILRAKLDGVLRAYDIFVLKKDGCVYDFVYVAPPARFAEATGEFEGFVSGFRALGAEP